MGSIARRSAGSWTLTVTGRSAHSAGVGAGNYGAIYELARIIDQFRRELPEDKLTYNVGLVGGGQSGEARPGPRSGWRRPARPTSSPRPRSLAATCARSARTRSTATRAKMRAIVAQPLAGAQRGDQLRRGRYPPMPPTEGNRALLAQLNGVNRDMGLRRNGRARSRRSAAPATSASSPPTSMGWSAWARRATARTPPTRRSTSRRSSSRRSAPRS